MDHYEGRKYPGWHHHMLLTMLAHVFLWYLKLRLGKKSSGAHGITSAAAPGSGRTLADVEDGRRPRVTCLATAAPSQRLSVAEKAA